ncbi:MULTISPECIES: nuclear transport factor 2 family protein [Streptomyces]|uniref:Ketosteroid isomerase-like protein n=1 Tax=Streptomyces nymphaeiformis TaxID=2663842 RepID=A0A7W7TZ56_9ACTN|nr:nuclear transport factor 2 family protein [Streptomyces nymphaeiformis]MBB4981177.1 ketosteroid isomerase-like protein [Streptomyces nymphaeiformis]
MNRQEDTSTGLPGPADLVTAAGIDHVRLVYDYLDAGDLDSCASLLHEEVVLELPGLPPFHGRAAVLHTHFGHTLPTARYAIDRVVGQDRSVVATGRRVVPGTDGQDLRFVDLFTIADDGMVLACTRYYHVAP